MYICIHLAGGDRPRARARGGALRGPAGGLDAAAGGQRGAGALGAGGGGGRGGGAHGRAVRLERLSVARR